ncbi:hypothetical protein [Microvirga thermotolerans]|uniref:General stress protein 17M-like domain-containing protein n=1 Tax=Microvirga thermotolerans TaxID=2651334 RepID=A0A5P9JTZ9_9HYPH|nr:hypothetical protein [Microvirga thermotolerans]QFU15903.1 hypothetical protein GDR74_06520 [Microvirga thermotolerans]
MAQNTITAFYENYDGAARAVSRLEAAGIPHADISLVASNANDAYSRHATRSFDEERERSEAAGTGATIGTLAGGGAGLLAGLGMLAIPGLGPVVAAGWLVSTLVGAGAGAAVGGLAGALVDAGVNAEEAEVYAEGIRRGGALVTVRTDEAEMGRIIDILDDEGRVDIEERREAWASEATEEPGPPIGAAASTATGLTTDMMPNPFDTDGKARTEVEVEDERERSLRERGLGRS